MKKIVWFLFAIFVALNISEAQKRVTIYLNNGSIIYGKVLEEHPDSIIKVLSNNNLWVFKAEDIERIEDGKHHIKEKDEDGFRFYASVLFTGDGIGFNTTAGYRLHDRYTAGVGTGADFSDLTWENYLFIPFYLEGRMDFYKRKRSPFLYLKGGYSIGIHENYYDYFGYENYKFSGGMSGGGGIGFKFRKESMGLNLLIGYHFQAARETYDYQQSFEPLVWANLKTYYRFHRFRIGAELSF